MSNADVWFQRGDVFSPGRSSSFFVSAAASLLCRVCGQGIPGKVRRLSFPRRRDKGNIPYFPLSFLRENAETKASVGLAVFEFGKFPAGDEVYLAESPFVVTDLAGVFFSNLSDDRLVSALIARFDKPPIVPDPLTTHNFPSSFRKCFTNKDIDRLLKRCQIYFF
jgi:hypothetical protein